MVAVVGDQVTRRGIRVVFAKVFVGLGDLGRGQTHLVRFPVEPFALEGCNAVPEATHAGDVIIALEIDGDGGYVGAWTYRVRPGKGPSFTVVHLYLIHDPLGSKEQDRAA